MFYDLTASDKLKISITLDVSYAFGRLLYLNEGNRLQKFYEEITEQNEKKITINQKKIDDLKLTLLTAKSKLESTADNTKTASKLANEIQTLNVKLEKYIEKSKFYENFDPGSPMAHVNFLINYFVKHLIVGTFILSSLWLTYFYFTSKKTNQNIKKDTYAIPLN